MEYDVLGGLAVRTDTGPLDLGGRKQRLVLALLVLAGGRPLAADRLIDLVWGEHAPERVSTSLQTYVSNLRRMLEPARSPREEPRVLLTRPGGYLLAIDRDQVDLHRFEDLVRKGEALHRRGEHERAAEQLAAALARWAPLLPEFDDEPTVREAARRLEVLHLVATERWFDARLAVGEGASLLPDLGEAVAASPLHERFRAQLALTLYRSGRQADALRALSEARRVLVEEVGVNPGPELRQLEADILDHSPSLGPAPRARPAPVEPREALAATPLLGRERELALATDALLRAERGAGAAVVVSGEPGIGKTRVAEELAARARERGTAVAWTRCPETAATAPFALLADVAEVLRAQGVVDLPDPGAHGDDAEADPIELRRRVVGALRSATRPSLVVVDDLQWADPASLRVIEYLAGDLAELSLLLLVTARPVTPDGPTALVDCLGELARVPGMVRLSLEGLPADVVERWVRQRLDTPQAAEIARFVHARSAGNPFFASELLELLRAERDLDVVAVESLRVPAAVADVVRRRIGRLPASTQQLLSVASVLGTTFDLDVVAGVVGEPMDQLLATLDPALDAGLVTEEPGTLVGYRFSHALVAEALVSELAASRRARLHARTVGALERARAGRLDAHAAQLAHHALAGARAGTAAPALHWSMRAAELADAALAPEDAAGHYERALSAAELVAPDDLRLRYRLLIALSRARTRAGSEERAQHALGDAIEVAAGIDDVPAMTSAACALAHPTLWQPGEYQGGDVRLARLVDLVLERLGPAGDTGERAVLLGFRATLGYYSLPRDEVDALSLGAVELARRSESPGVLATTLLQRIQSMWVPGSARARIDIADEMVALARTASLGADVETVGRLARLVAAYELGHADDAEADDLVAVATARGTALAQLEVITFRVARFGTQGRYREARELAASAGELFRRTGRRAAAASLIGSTVLSLVDTGRLDELTGAVGASDPTYALVTTEMYAFALVESGLLEEARAVIGRPGSTPSAPFDWLWLVVNQIAALVRVAVGDETAAAELETRLVPYAGHVALAGSLPVVGSVDYALGRLCSLRGDQDAAARHLDRAVALDEAMGSSAWVARALEARFEVSGAPADRERASQIAEEIGCEPVLRRLGARPLGRG